MANLGNIHVFSSESQYTENIASVANNDLALIPVEEAMPTDYITGLSVNGKVITYTKKDGTTGTITTQDTNTTYTLADFGITATANELNKLDGVTASTEELNRVSGITENVQEQLDNKLDADATAAKATADADGNVITTTYATKGHTHNYAGSSAAGGAATSANKLNADAGSTTQPVYFSNGVPVATTYALNKTVPADAVFTDTVYTLPAATNSTLGGVKVGTNITLSSDTISVANGSTDVKGVVQLTDSTSSTSTTTAATPNSVKSAYDLANSKQSPATTLSGYGITNAYTKAEVDAKVSEGVGSVDLSGCVTLSTSQEIPGKKTFSANNRFVSDQYITAGNAIKWFQNNEETTLGYIDQNTYTGTAAKAISDSSGNNITTTYARKGTTLVEYGITDAYSKTEIENLLSSGTIGSFDFTASEWVGPVNSLYTLTREVGLAKVLGIYKGDSANGYEAVEVDDINITAGGTLTLTAPNSFNGTVLMSAAVAFNNDVAESINDMVDGKVEEAMSGDIDNKVSVAVADSLVTKANAADVYTKTESDGLISDHNISASAHNDIRTLITKLTTRVNTLADSDDTTLDQMSEVVSYIKSNRNLIDSVTTAKADKNKVIALNKDGISTAEFGFEVIDNELFLLNSLSENSAGMATLNANVLWGNIQNKPASFDVIYPEYTTGLYKFSTNSMGQVTGATAVTKADITGLGITYAASSAVGGAATNVNLTADTATTTAYVPFAAGSGSQALKYHTGFTFNASTGALSATKVYNAVYNDYAEFFPRGEETEVGDIIALDMGSEDEKYVKATADSIVAGVHSGEYAHIIGGDEAPEGEDFVEYNISKYIPISLAGRVHVKVIGPVKRGNYIIASNISGVGIATDKPTNERAIVGYAVETNDSEDVKLIRVRVKGA